MKLRAWLSIKSTPYCTHNESNLSPICRWLDWNGRWEAKCSLSRSHEGVEGSWRNQQPTLRSSSWNRLQGGVDEWEGSHPLCSERFKCVQRGEIERLPGPISFQSGLTYSSVTTESSSSIGGFTDTEGNGGSNGQLSGTWTAPNTGRPLGSVMILSCIFLSLTINSRLEKKHLRKVWLPITPWYSIYTMNNEQIKFIEEVIRKMPDFAPSLRTQKASVAAAFAKALDQKTAGFGFSSEEFLVNCGVNQAWFFIKYRLHSITWKTTSPKAKACHSPPPEMRRRKTSTEPKRLAAKQGENSSENRQSNYPS